MSTRGTFVIVKDVVGKELDIQHDAYPKGAGADIAELIKSVNLSELYDYIVDYDDAEMDYYDDMDAMSLEDMDIPDEPDAFDIAQCRKTLKRNGTLYGTVPSDISGCNPISTEYAYVINQDESILTLYRNRCILRRTAPLHDGNDNICETVDIDDKDAHAVALTQDEAGNRYVIEEKAVFDLEFIKRCSIEKAVALMDEACEKKAGHVSRYTVSDLTPELEKTSGYSDYIGKATGCIQSIMDRMEQCRQKMADCRLYSRKRANEILHSCKKVDNSLKELEEIVGLLM